MGYGIAYCLADYQRQKHASSGLSPAELMLPGHDINAHMYLTKQLDVVSDYIQNSIFDKKVRESHSCTSQI